MEMPSGHGAEKLRTSANDGSRGRVDPVAREKMEQVRGARPCWGCKTNHRTPHAALADPCSPASSVSSRLLLSDRVGRGDDSAAPFDYRVRHPHQDAEEGERERPDQRYAFVTASFGAHHHNLTLPLLATPHPLLRLQVPASRPRQDTGDHQEGQRPNFDAEGDPDAPRGPELRQGAFLGQLERQVGAALRD